MTDINQAGTYYVKAGKDSSLKFVIDESVYRKLPDILLSFMRQQRCGYNPFWEEVCHQQDGRTFYGPLPDSSYIDVSGGWHDAGDDLKYLLTSSYATAAMLLAYQLNPDIFEDHADQWGHPQSNGIPDVLDEARWGLEWMHRLHPAADQLYHQVADDRDHIGWKFPFRDSSDYGWGKGSYRVVYYAEGKPQGLARYQSNSDGIANLAGRYTAAMALASQIWKSVLSDTVFAEKCARSALEVYSLGKMMPGVQQGNSYGAPYRYAEMTWADDMEWGAAELFRLTGQERYRRDARYYAGMIQTVSWMGRDSTAHYQFYPFQNAGHFSLYGITDPEQQIVLAEYYRDGIEKIYRRAVENPFGVGIPFIWCSNNLAVALMIQIQFYQGMKNDNRYEELLLNQRDWLLGRNPWGTSMLVGIPAWGESPEHPHTSTYALTGREITGGLVDGPVYRKIFQSLKGLYLSSPDEFAEFQTDYIVYHDDIADYSTNEPTLDGTAAAILAFSLLSREKDDSGEE